MKRSNFEVLGLCCASEAELIERILKPLHGVEGISVIVPTRTVTVTHDVLLISDSQIADALNSAKLEASLKPQGQGEANIENKWPDLPTLVCGLLLALSFFKSIYHPLGWLALGSVAIGIPKVLLRAIASIRALTLNINILVLLAVCATSVLQDFWEAGVIIFLFSIAQWLETRATHKAVVAMSSLTSLAPQKAVVAETGERVDVNDVEINTILAVKAGDAIPLDGVVVEGKCEVDEKMLTGESFPVTKELDSGVWAGTINLNGYISVRTTVLAKDTVVARMSKLVEDAHSRKSRAQTVIDNFAKYYIPVVVLISASIAVVPAALRVPDIKPWFHLAIVVLLSGCPCALILSTPVAIFCALTKAATNGLLLKGGDYLETLSGIKTVAFDKTGTITRGEFTVTDFCAIEDNIIIETLLYWVSSIESKSSHPMAAALIEYGMLHSIKPIPENVENFQNFPGEGIYGKIDGKDIYIGNRRIGVRAGCERDPVFQVQEERNGYIYCGQALIGVFSLADACRSGALEAIEELKSIGVRSVMLTGDSTQAAKYVESQLNHALDIVHAELLPEEKAVIIENFKKDGLTAMVGDGFNDAPALATADIGISMGLSGSALAIETGNAILMSNDICKIPEAIMLARKTTRKLIENLIISISTKVAILALAIAGYPIVWLAVLTDVGTCLLVILNSMLILQEKPKADSDYRNRKPKYGKDKSITLLDEQSKSDEQVGLLTAEKCGKECCKNDSHHGATTNASKHEALDLWKLGLLKRNHQGNLLIHEVHTVKPCNDFCSDEVKVCEDSSCQRKNSTDCCQPNKEVLIKDEKCGNESVVLVTQDARIATLKSATYKDKSMDTSELSGTSGIIKCCKKGCCNNRVNDIGNLTEIFIE
ncbi:hypothetical protein RIF29_04160 [Crotalaria pallida]|uniref:HMA domain-containing protein n=1 Tax=Crotalaria pallida TaxID=3830 RepID=A0AAN9J1H3_CROPI